MATPPDFTAGQVLTAAQMNAIGLWLVKSQTIGTTVSSVTVSDAFSADFDNYKITVSGGTCSSSGQFITFVLGAANTGYYAAVAGGVYATGAASVSVQNNATSLNLGLAIDDGLYMNADLVGPNLAKHTNFTFDQPATNSARTGTGFQDSTTAFTAFTIAPGAGTLTGGEIRVYGYRN